MSRILKVENVSKKYGSNGNLALDNVSVEVEKGEILSLLGVNGAGKTTLFSIMTGMKTSSSGSIYAYNENIYKNLSYYKSKIGHCPQKPNLDNSLTVYENLWFAGKFFLIKEENLKARIDLLGSKLNLTKYFNFNVDDLSGGYKQRVLIARALIHNPEILFFDEPTVGLDPHVRRNIWSIILELKNEGKTIILTTHYLDEAEYLSDRVCILEKGKVLMIEKAEDLKSMYKKKNLEEVFLHLMQEEQNEFI